MTYSIDDAQRIRNPSIADSTGVHSIDLGDLTEHNILRLIHDDVKALAIIELTSALTYMDPKPAPPISAIAGTSVMITPQMRYEYKLEFGKRISHLTLTERDALELIQRLRESIRAARKAQAKPS